MKTVWDNFFGLSLLTFATLTTLIISPNFAYDPINLPKMLILATGAFSLIPYLVISLRQIFNISFIAILFSGLLLASLCFSLLINERPFAQQLWGVWGRNTGFLTYLSFIIIFLATISLAYNSEFSLMRISFERLSYGITIYTLMQAGGVDPINWSQKQMVATLGNLNFMSSFLGLAAISFGSRIVLEKISLTSKLHYLFFASLNLFLIWISGSIQGIGVFFAGLMMLLAFKIRMKKSFFHSSIWIILACGMGFVLFLGTSGIGPLKALKQITVIFRRDYWLSGWKMTLDNWLNGVGIDSYGDYYEQYRDFAAVTRTGPERVANTAHNIFLDISSGSGALSGVYFIALFILVISLILGGIKHANLDPTFMATSAMFFGFLVFCLISINQIGVGVWGFIFAGYLIGASKRLAKDSTASKELESRKLRAEKKNLVNDSKRGYKLGLGSFSFGVIGLLLALPPNINDAQMLTAIKSGDMQKMEKVVTQSSTNSQFAKKYMTMLLDKGEVQAAYVFALRELKRDPRNDIALRVVAYNENAPVSQRKAALVALKIRDPENREFVKYIDELMFKLG